MTNILEHLGDLTSVTSITLELVNISDTEDESLTSLLLLLAPSPVQVCTITRAGRKSPLMQWEIVLTLAI
jgi:hypothetical protein